MTESTLTLLEKKKSSKNFNYTLRIFHLTFWNYIFFLFTFSNIVFWKFQVYHAKSYPKVSLVQMVIASYLFTIH